MEKGKVLYSGKAKTLYATNDDKHLICHFRDDTSAFNGEKIAQLSRKGMVNNYVNAFVMSHLQDNGIDTHFVERLSDTDSLVKKLEMFPLECVVRNVSAGSLCKRLGVESGQDLSPPLFEFFLKDDALGDPMINDYHILTFGWAKEDDIEQMKRLTFKVNDCLKTLFDKAGMILVDYKLEFGKFGTQIVLGDEFTSDGCRLWDKETRKVLDKDRFRQDMGDVIEAYEEVALRLGVDLPAREPA